MTDEQTKDRSRHPDPLFDLLLDPETRDNAVIRACIDAMRFGSFDRETALITMVKYLAGQNELLFKKAVLGEQMRPVVYHVHGDKLTREDE